MPRSTTAPPREGSLRYRLTRAAGNPCAAAADHVTTICEGLRSDIVGARHPGAEGHRHSQRSRYRLLRARRHARRGTASASSGWPAPRSSASSARFYAYEGLDLLLAGAAARCCSAAPDVRVLLVGGGPQDAALKAQAQRLGLADKVVFTGRVPHDEVQRYYDLVDVLAYPRHSMRLTELVTPLKPLEAMAQGRLLVASRRRRPQGTDPRTARPACCSRPADADALAEAVMRLLDERDRWPACARAGRALRRARAQLGGVSVARYRPVLRAPGRGQAAMANARRPAHRRAQQPVPQRRAADCRPVHPRAHVPRRPRSCRWRWWRPQPWFPLQGLLRRWKPGFRPGAPRTSSQQGIDVWFPRFLSVPGAAEGAWTAASWRWAPGRACARLKRAGRLDLIDAHFAYPDGYAATLLGRWLGVPVTITLRGTEPRHANDPALAPRLVHGAAARRRSVFAVSESLRQVALGLGVAARRRCSVVGNGVDLQQVPRRCPGRGAPALGLPADAPVLVSVGGLVERKGFHRVIELLPALRAAATRACIYLVVGGPSPEGDMTAELQRQVAAAGPARRVRFLGAAAAGATARAALGGQRLRARHAQRRLGQRLPRSHGLRPAGGDHRRRRQCRSGVPRRTGHRGAVRRCAALQAALAEALHATLGRATAIRRHAEANTWDRRVDELVEHVPPPARTQPAPAAPARARPRLSSGSMGSLYTAVHLPACVFPLHERLKRHDTVARAPRTGRNAVVAAEQLQALAGGAPARPAHRCRHATCPTTATCSARRASTRASSRALADLQRAAAS